MKVLKKCKPDPAVITVTEEDLLIQQSMSRISNRQLHKQKKLWKSLLKEQGCKINIAGRGKVENLRKERVDDLFNISEVRGNVGTEKHPEFKTITVIYCTDICELAIRVARHRNEELGICKLQGDHGQGSFKLSIQFNFSNSVSTLMILALTEESKDTIETTKQIEKLVNPQLLEENLGMKVLRTGDLQYLQLSIGIKTGNASYPCPFCYWRMTGNNRDAVDSVCTQRNIQKDLECFTKHGSNRNKSNLCHGQQGVPAFCGYPSDVFVPGTLHINLGLVNHTLEKMEIKHGEHFMQENLYAIAKVHKTKYQGVKFEGNECQKIVKAFNKILWPANHPFCEYQKLFYALETTNDLVLIYLELRRISMNMTFLILHFQLLKLPLNGIN